MNNQNRTVMVFHAPISLAEGINDIAQNEMMSKSSVCRMAVNNFVQSYGQQSSNNNNLSEDKTKI